MNQELKYEYDVLCNRLKICNTAYKKILIKDFERRNRIIYSEHGLYDESGRLLFEKENIN